MGARRFEVRTTLGCAPERAVDFLIDLDRHRGLHPFVESATVMDSGTDSGTGPGGEWWDWQVVERPKLGPLRYRIRFRARVARTSPTTMTVVVRAAPGCWLRSWTSAEAADGGCRLVETTEVTAPWPVLGYMARTGQAAHERTYSRLPTEVGVLGPE
jgi:hypothetical protein